MQFDFVTERTFKETQLSESPIKSYIAKYTTIKAETG